MNHSATFSDLQGKSVFITGGGSGIGASLTEGFIAQGAKVAFVQRSDASDFCNALEQKYKNRPLYLPCDVTDIEALKQSISDARSAHGPIAVLVNNAANDQRHDIDGYTVAEWDHAMNVNLRHHYFAIQAVVEDMRSMGGGSIINYSSVSYMMGNAGYVAYMSAKAAITGMTRGLARELGPDNIRVNALMPGWVLTERQKKLWATPEALAEHIGRQCLRLEIQPEDMVAPTLFLASDAARVITSQALVVDAGIVVTG